MIPFICLQCGQKLEVPEDYVGQKIRCPVCATIATVYAPKAAASGPEIVLPDTGKSRDVAAVLEAKFHGHGPGEKAVPGAGGTKQYDLSAVLTPPAEATGETAETAEKPAADGAPVAAPSSSATEAAEGEAEPDSAETPPIVAMPVGPHGKVASPAPAAARPPGYLGVLFIGYSIIVSGILCWLSGLGVVLFLVVEGFRSGDLRAAILSVDLSRAIAVGLFILGLVLVGMGQLFLCVRDMARNSFHLRKL